MQLNVMQFETRHTHTALHVYAGIEACQHTHRNDILEGTQHTSSKDDSKFMPKATPIKPNKEREKVPMVSCRFRRIITFRWLGGGDGRERKKESRPQASNSKKRCEQRGEGLEHDISAINADVCLVNVW